MSELSVPESRINWMSSYEPCAYALSEELQFSSGKVTYKDYLKRINEVCCHHKHIAIESPEGSSTLFHIGRAYCTNMEKEKINHSDVLKKIEFVFLHTQTSFIYGRNFVLTCVIDNTDQLAKSYLKVRLDYSRHQDPSKILKDLDQGLSLLLLRTIEKVAEVLIPLMKADPDNGFDMSSVQDQIPFGIRFFAYEINKPNNKDHLLPFFDRNKILSIQSAFETIAACRFLTTNHPENIDFFDKELDVVMLPLINKRTDLLKTDKTLENSCPLQFFPVLTTIPHLSRKGSFSYSFTRLITFPFWQFTIIPKEDVKVSDSDKDPIESIPWCFKSPVPKNRPLSILGNLEPKTPPPEKKTSGKRLLVKEPKKLSPEPQGRSMQCIYSVFETIRDFFYSIWEKICGTTSDQI